MQKQINVYVFFCVCCLFLIYNFKCGQSTITVAIINTDSISKVDTAIYVIKALNQDIRFMNWYNRKDTIKKIDDIDVIPHGIFKEGDTTIYNFRFMSGDKDYRGEPITYDALGLIGGKIRFAKTGNFRFDFFSDSLKSYNFIDSLVKKYSQNHKYKSTVRITP